MESERTASRVNMMGSAFGRVRCDLSKENSMNTCFYIALFVHVTRVIYEIVKAALTFVLIARVLESWS